mgnify:FL=1
MDPPRVTRDRDDDYLIALAIAGAVDALVSIDKDLLEADTSVSVVRPARFLELLAARGPTRAW